MNRRSLLEILKGYRLLKFADAIEYRLAKFKKDILIPNSLDLDIFVEIGDYLWAENLITLEGESLLLEAIKKRVARTDGERARLAIEAANSVKQRYHARKARTVKGNE